MSLQIVVLSVVLNRNSILAGGGGGAAAHLGGPSGKAIDWRSVFCPKFTVSYVGSCSKISLLRSKTNQIDPSLV